MERVVPDGKHLRVGGAPFRLRGATYGHFQRRADGNRFPEPPQVERDLVAMAEHGLNTVRTYSVPPVDLLDAARALGLRVLAGLDYPDWRMHAKPSRATRRAVRVEAEKAVASALEVLAGRPEVLAISVANEVPSDVARMYGKSGVEDVLSEAVALVHEGDPEMLVTCTSYPTAEFLRVEGQDLATYNVFLERSDQLRAYLRHLQRVSGGIPLVLTEVGLAAELHGDAEQARSLRMQLDLVDECGCAGATVFSWTDEWASHAGPVEGWGFGLTRVDRSPRPSLEVVSRWSRRSIRDLRPSWPSVSVVVCAYNEERRIGECLDSLARVDYPGLEVLVCDDGSTDRTLELARRSPFRVLALPHAGLSAARNAGMSAASGDIVAYLDADAACHPEWPYHLALAFEDPHVLAAGGPNLPVPGAGLVERAVALSPGSPVEVLVGDDRAEHVPGCNLAVRTSALRRIGGFEPAYTAAGDDVDVCWRLMDEGGQVAFSPAAQVHHHRRGTVRGYLRQQRGYGRAERMLAGQHRHRFNRWGAARWSGLVYGGTRLLPRLLRPIVYHGPMGVAPFQTEVRDRAAPVVMWASTLVPLLVGIGLLVLPVALLAPVVLLVPAAVTLALLGYAACVAVATEVAVGEPSPWRLRGLVAVLHLLQPCVRAWGRVRAHPLPARAVPVAPWTGTRESWLGALHRDLSSQWCAVRCGPPHASWDLEVQVGPLLRCRIGTAVMWGWVPVARRTWLPTRLAVLALGLATLALAVPAGGTARVAAAVGWLALLLCATVEAVGLARLSRGAVARTTRAAQVTR